MPEVASHNLVAGIGSSLPLARGSSIFVRVDEQNVQLWKALITGVVTALQSWVLHGMLPGSCNAEALCCIAGPTDTPYGYGCFEFDM